MLRVWSVVRSGARDLVTPPPANVPGLDLLRSLAILLVVSGHYYGDFAASRVELSGLGKLPFLYFAWTGVDLFFVLSGYLIGGQLWRELLRRGTLDVPRFLLRRGLRIWPFYFAFLAAVFITSPKPAAAFLPDVLFLSNYLPNSISGGWSLSTEEQFYIFMPVLLVAMNRVLPVRRQYLVIIALLALLPLVRLATLNTHPAVVGVDEFRKLIQLPFHTHADGLLAGVLLSWLAALQPRYLTPLPLRRNLLVPAALGVAGFMLRNVSPHLFAFSGLALIFGGLTLFVLRDRSLFSRLASSRLFYITSRLSYGMYLNHFPVLSFCVPALMVVTQAMNPFVGFLIGYPLAVLSTMAVAAVTFITVESPFLQLREHWLAGRKRSASADLKAGEAH